MHEVGFNMLVESNDKEGAEVYEMIIKQIFQDLQLSPSIKDMRVFVNPDDVVFIIAIKMDKTSTLLRLKDIATVKYDKEENKTFIRIIDEIYLPNALKKLMIELGRENIAQPNRYTIAINGKVKDIEDIVVFSPKDNLKKRVYDAIFRIIPEGFRIIRDISEEDVIAVICTDELIKDSWIEKGKKFVQELNLK
jgi:putative methanogenesis marker protein 17